MGTQITDKKVCPGEGGRGSADQEKERVGGWSKGRTSSPLLLLLHTHGTVKIKSVASIDDFIAQ